MKSTIKIIIFLVLLSGCGVADAPPEQPPEPTPEFEKVAWEIENTEVRPVSNNVWDRIIDVSNLDIQDTDKSVFLEFEAVAVNPTETYDEHGIKPPIHYDCVEDIDNYDYTNTGTIEIQLGSTATAECSNAERLEGIVLRTNWEMDLVNTIVYQFQQKQ